MSYGKFDLDWLLRSLRFGVTHEGDAAPPLAIDGTKGIPAIESFLLARLFMFQQVYFHKTERSCEWMLARALERAQLLIADGVRLPGTPPGLAALLRDGDASLGEYLELDDPAADLGGHLHLGGLHVARRRQGVGGRRRRAGGDTGRRQHESET